VFRLAGGAANYTYNDALATVRGYMCETEEIVPKSRFAGAFKAEQVPRFAYRTYDCVAASPGPELTDLDVLIVVGLNLRVDVSILVRLRSFADRAAKSLEQAQQRQSDFRKLTVDELGDEPA
jgi:hypothetical protein